jgi:DNA-binding GntR family transcriptional regulator
VGRPRTPNAPDLSALLGPANPLMRAVEQAILRDKQWTGTAVPVAEQIAIRLAGVISLDQIHAGQRLLEVDISAVLRVSRAPVREALRILERERLVAFEARRGAYVTAPDPEDLRDIYTVRAALSEILLREVMAERPEELSSLLDEHLPRLAKAAGESADAYAVANFLLNLQMNELSSNRFAVDLLASILLRTLRYVRLAFETEPKGREASLASWRALKRAADKRDVELLLKAARKRMDNSFASTVRVIDARTAPAGAGEDVPAPATRRTRPPRATAGPRPGLRGA